jgi:hypothetical protein
MNREKQLCVKNEREMGMKSERKGLSLLLAREEREKGINDN